MLFFLFKFKRLILELLLAYLVDLLHSWTDAWGCVVEVLFRLSRKKLIFDEHVEREVIAWHLKPVLDV